MARTGCAIIALIAVLMAAPSAAAQGISVADVQKGFADAVSYCAQASLKGGGIADLPADRRSDLSPAGDEMRSMAPDNKSGPLWDVKSGKGIVVISEPRVGECQVTAYGPPIGPSFEAVTRALTAGELAFKEVESPPTTKAIIRTFERDGVRVRLDGSAPGMPDHMFRFTLLLAYVSRGALTP
jgi:hypothetical protein